MLKQNRDMIPASLAEERRFIEMTGSRKSNTPKGWNNPENWKTLDDIPEGKYFGFVAGTGSNYLFVDWDHVFDKDGKMHTGAYEVFKKVSALAPIYCERSMSGSGLHMIADLGDFADNFDPVDNKAEEIILWMDPDEYDKLSKSERENIPKIELFYHVNGRYVFLTGDTEKPVEVARNEDAAAIFRELLKVREENHKKYRKAAGSGEEKKERKAPDGRTQEKVFDALPYISAAEYHTWIHVGIALYNEGFAFEVWDTWSQFMDQRTGEIYPRYDEKETAAKWKSFKNSKSRWNVGTIFNLAKAGGWIGSYLLMPKQWSDVDQAKVFIQEYGHMVKFSKATNWIVYDGSRWVENELDARKLSQELTERQLAEARGMLAAARKKSDDAVEAEDPEETGATKKEIRKAEKCRSEVLKRRKSSSITATLAEAAPGCQIDVMELDADPYLLNTPGGTVDLRTGKIRPHDPEDYCTKITAVSPDDKNADVWETFIDQITLGDKDLARYLQEIVGLSIIGTVKREELLIATGGGNNGKSTCFNTIHKVLGDYAGMLSAETLTVKSRKNKSPEYAELRGKRFIIAAELEEGQLLDTATVKKLCSTDPIIAEKKFKDPFVFTPSHHVLLYTNHLPRVGSTDKGTWRRLVTIPFLAAFEEGKGQIKDYETYLFNHCAGAVLSWLIRGAQRAIIQDFIIEIPQCVKDAIQEYKEASDWLSNFISEWCAVGPGRYATGRELHERYKEYCDHTGEFKRSPSAFSQALEAAGFKKKPTKRGNVYYGISILDYQQRQMEIQADKSDGIAQWKKDFAVRVEDG